jgi:lipoyl(octanoyl) transferase
MRWSYLGLIPYDAALALQEELRAGVSRGACLETLLLLEHPPVITLGRSALSDHVLVSEVERQRRGVALAAVGRGGDVTYHGPGQLVGYPIRVVGKMVRSHVQAMVESIIALLRRLGIESWYDDGRPGVWCSVGKIAAVGVDARGGVAIHGFALNVSTRLADYGMIVPCGIQAPVTSIEALLGSSRTPSVEGAARLIAPDLCRRFGSPAVEVAPGQVREAVA